MEKPELLAPAGNIEAFYAAIEAGADAVYLGLEHFNARQRASNFSYRDLPVILSEAAKNNVNIYITLNTLIKNHELPTLIDLLSFLNQVKPQGIIIQDWGVFHIIKKHFPKLKVHASTQMAIHNSNGINFAGEQGIIRVIPARETTMKELKEISKKSSVELEVFIHGALCYSFSGICHFSSYLGGHSANRGLCTQVCRRAFKVGDRNRNLFNLRDQMQASSLSALTSLGVKAFKIEGRLKSDEYVYKVTKSYRDLIDGFLSVKEAEEILLTDGGREKTGYFIASDLRWALTEQTTSGYYLGKITKTETNSFYFNSAYNFPKLFRLRIENQLSGKTQNLKVRNYIHEAGKVKVISKIKCNRGDSLFLIGEQEKKFAQKLPPYKKNIPALKAHNKREILNSFIKKEAKKQKSELFIRINSLDWLRKIHFQKIDALILNIPANKWDQFNIRSHIIQSNLKKIWIEFPTYIPENKIEFYQSLGVTMVKQGIRQFMLSDISQKRMLPREAIFCLNENAYAFNDAAIQFYLESGAKTVSYPTENDRDNLLGSRYRGGIILLYFYPRLFHSRMPVKTSNESIIIDDTGNKYYKDVVSGITTIYPVIPVSWLQYTREFKQKGFFRFLIDLSYEKPSSNRFNTLIKRYSTSTQIQPSSNFNFKLGIK